MAADLSDSVAKSVANRPLRSWGPRHRAALGPAGPSQTKAGFCLSLDGRRLDYMDKTTKVLSSLRKHVVQLRLDSMNDLKKMLAEPETNATTGLPGPLNNPQRTAEAQVLCTQKNRK